MPRPLRNQWVPRTYGRRRHRIWMWSMTAATVGWGIWWVAVAIVKLFPSMADSVQASLGWLTVLSTLIAAAGIGLALLTVRAKRSWLLFSFVALFANLSLLLLPWVAGDLSGGPLE